MCHERLLINSYIKNVAIGWRSVHWLPDRCVTTVGQQRTVSEAQPCSWNRRSFQLCSQAHCQTTPSRFPSVNVMLADEVVVVCVHVGVGKFITVCLVKWLLHVSNYMLLLIVSKS